jgi:hypothetical protein
MSNSIRPNSVMLKIFWCSEYKNKFGENFTSKIPVVIELSLLKKLDKEYGYYAVLEAIEAFMERMKKEYCHITFFYKIFKDKYQDAIRLRYIAKYKRLRDCFPEEIRKPLTELLEEYIICSHEMMSSYDVSRRNMLLEQIEKLADDYIKEQGWKVA